MGKSRKKSTFGSKYVHNHTHNPIARESDERKLERLHSLEIKRLKGIIEKNLAILKNYLPESERKQAAVGKYCLSTIVF